MPLRVQETLEALLALGEIVSGGSSQSRPLDEL